MQITIFKEPRKHYFWAFFLPKYMENQISSKNLAVRFCGLWIPNQMQKNWKTKSLDFEL